MVKTILNLKNVSGESDIGSKDTPDERSENSDTEHNGEDEAAQQDPQANLYILGKEGVIKWQLVPPTANRRATVQNLL